METENYIKEKELSSTPKSIPLEALDFLISKAKTNICKIECSDGGHGTGFFCNIPTGWNSLKVLMTNNHVLNKDDISIDKKIKFSLNNDKIFYEIQIDEARKIYTNDKYDITILEIKQNDKLDKISFFDVDDRIFQEENKDIFKNMQIYLLHYPKGNKMEYSMGLIKNINEDNYTIRHSCDTNSGSSGCPIINSINFQVIGIHKGAAEKGKNYNLGTILKEPIEKFNNNDENDKKECIKENENNKNENVNIEYVKENENNKNESVENECIRENENNKNESVENECIKENKNNKNENVTIEYVKENDNSEKNKQENTLKNYIKENKNENIKNEMKANNENEKINIKNSNINNSINYSNNNNNYINTNIINNSNNNDSSNNNIQTIIKSTIIIMPLVIVIQVLIIMTIFLIMLIMIIKLI